MAKAVNIKNWMVAAAAGVAALLCIHKKKSGVSGIGATKNKQKKFYVYAGYWENYISSEPMPNPYIIRRAFRNIDNAIDYAESLGDTIIYCDNVKYDLPDYLYEALQDEDYEYFEY